MALCQQGGWTAELGEAASDFGGWEEGETAKIPTEPGAMQPEARHWSKVSIAGFAGVRVVSCTSQGRRLDGNVAVTVCPAACSRSPRSARWAPKPD